MSAHTRRKAQTKYKQSLLSERESNQPLISTAMSEGGTSETASGTSECRRGARGERRHGHRPMPNNFSIDYQLRLCVFVMLNKSHVSISLLSFHSYIQKKILLVNADVFTQNPRPCPTQPRPDFYMGFIANSHAT